jgi:hypothetical protein
MKLYKYPSIDTYRNLIKGITLRAQFVGKDDDGNAIYDSSKELPTLEFFGTVKLHGTNGAVCFDTRTNEFYAQSRERILSMESDNAGFNFFVQANKTTFMNMINEYWWREGNYKYFSTYIYIQLSDTLSSTTLFYINNKLLLVVTFLYL